MARLRWLIFKSFRERVSCGLGETGSMGGWTGGRVDGWLGGSVSGAPYFLLLDIHVTR